MRLLGFYGSRREMQLFIANNFHLLESPLSFLAPIQLELGLGRFTELGGNMLSQATNVLEHVSRVVLAQLDSQGVGFPIRAFVVGPKALEGLLNAATASENNLMITRLLAAHMRTFAADQHVEVLIRNGDILLESRIEPVVLVNKCHSRVKLKRGGIKVMVSRNTALKAAVGAKNIGQNDVRGTVFLSGDIEVAFKMDVEVDVSVGKELAYFCLGLVDKSFPVQIETHAKVWVGAKIAAADLRVEDRPFEPGAIGGGLGNLGNLLTLLTTPRPSYQPQMQMMHLMPVMSAGGMYGVPVQPVAYAPAYQSGGYPINSYNYPAQNTYNAPAGVAHPVPFYNAGYLQRRMQQTRRQIRSRLGKMLGMDSNMKKKRKKRKRRRRSAQSSSYGAPTNSYGSPRPSYAAPEQRFEKHLVFRVGVDLMAEIKHWDVDKLRILKGCDVHLFKYKIFSYCNMLQDRLTDFVTHFVTEISEDGLPIVLNGVEKFFNTTVGSEIAVPLLLADEKGAILSTVFQKMDQVRLLKKDLLKDLTGLIKSTGKLVPGDPIELFADTAAVIGEAVHSGVASLRGTVKKT